MDQFGLFTYIDIKPWYVIYSKPFCSRRQSIEVLIKP